jgi:hypothetical protein
VKAAAPRRLALVPCHAVYCGHAEAPPTCDAAWRLQTFQAGEPPFYIEHIRRGVALAAADPSVRLLFSGGATRREAGPQTEADGYLAVARLFRWWGEGGVSAQTGTETFARDSFENLLFGLCRFRALYGVYPDDVIVAGWEFKRARFELHRRAIGFPAERFAYVGVNNPPNLAAALDGERRNASLPFQADPYGMIGVLAEKRAARNPFHRTPPYAAERPELAALLAHVGPEPFQGALPWRTESQTAKPRRR